MNTNAAFFPVVASKTESGMTISPSRGIQVRDGVAIHCLQGILANPEFLQIEDAADENGPVQAAKIAYKFADALIEASQLEP